MIISGKSEAFTVGVNYLEYLLYGEIVVYNDVITNYTTAAGYDITSGKYHAPEDGIYIFFYHSMAFGGQVS